MSCDADGGGDNNTPASKTCPDGSVVYGKYTQCPDDKPASEINCHSYFAYLEVENIVELYNEYQSKEVDILSSIENKPWGQREFSIRTIDGHRITFGEEISSKLFEKIDVSVNQKHPL